MIRSSKQNVDCEMNKWKGCCTLIKENKVGQNTLYIINLVL